MENTIARKKKSAILLNKIKTFFVKPQNVILLLFGIVLTCSTFAPVIAIRLGQQGAGGTQRDDRH